MDIISLLNLWNSTDFWTLIIIRSSILIIMVFSEIIFISKKKNFFHRKRIINYYRWLFFLIDITLVINIWPLSIFFSVLLILENNVFVNANIQDFKKIYSNQFKYIDEENIKNKEINDKDAIYLEIEKAVTTLSRTKTGALITFEKNIPLEEFCKSGVVLNAPVKEELLETIFFEGTRLHDGGVVIKNGLIKMAAAFYPSTNKNLIGKYGARHRAGIGISEVTDSVTIIISEETGRISFAKGGELTVIKLEDFKRSFYDFMENNKD